MWIISVPSVLRSVIPVVCIRTIVDQWSKNSSQKHNYIFMYNSVPTTCFGRFLTGHHQVWYNAEGTTYPLKYSHWWQCECSIRGGSSSDIVSNLMMASKETAETCSWYAIVHTNIVVFLTAILWSLIYYSSVPSGTRLCTQKMYTNISEVYAALGRRSLNREIEKIILLP